MNNFLFSIFMIYSPVAKSSEKIICNDGSEYEYTGKFSNYTPYDLCKSNGGVLSFDEDRHNFENNFISLAERIDISLWVSPFSQKNLYIASVPRVHDQYATMIDTNIRKNYRSVGVNLASKYLYLDLALTTYASNVLTYAKIDLNGEKIQAYTPHLNVFGGISGYGLSIPIIYKNGNMKFYCGMYNERSFVGQYLDMTKISYNSYTYGIQYGVSALIKKIRLDVSATDALSSIDFVPKDHYSNDDLGISFKVGYNIF